MYKVDTPTNSLHSLQKVSFSGLGFTERYHLQEWLAKHPQALTRSSDDELLIIQKEFAGLSSLSFASFAAVEVQATPEGQQKFGTISANGGTNLGSLEDQLAQKAQEMGAKSFRITSVTGPNTLHGTAVIYK